MLSFSSYAPSMRPAPAAAAPHGSPTRQAPRAPPTTMFLASLIDMPSPKRWLRNPGVASSTPRAMASAPIAPTAWPYVIDCSPLLVVTGSHVVWPGCHGSELGELLPPGVLVVKVSVVAFMNWPGCWSPSMYALVTTVVVVVLPSLFTTVLLL